MSWKSFHRSLLCSLGLVFGLFTAGQIQAAPETARRTIVRAILAPTEVQKREIITSLAGQGDEAIRELFTAWREDSLFVYTAPDGTKVPVALSGLKDANGAQAALSVDNGTPLLDASGQPLRLVGTNLVAVEHDATLRRTMKAVVDLIDLGSPDITKRLRAIHTFGFAPKPDKLAALQARSLIETDDKAKDALHLAITLIQLADPSDEVKLKSLAELRHLHSSASYDLVKATQAKAAAAAKPAIVAAAYATLAAIDHHRSVVSFFGTLFRGL